MAWLVTWDDEYEGRIVLARRETEAEAQAICDQLTPPDLDRWQLNVGIEEEECVGYGPSAKWRVWMNSDGSVSANPKPPYGDEVSTGSFVEMYALSQAAAKQRFIDERGLQPKLDALKAWRSARPS